MPFCCIWCTLYKLIDFVYYYPYEICIVRLADEEQKVVAKNGREKALDVALANLTKRFGEGAIMRLGEATHLNIETIPTGSLALDYALGAGGIPRGRVTEVYGPEGAGKTTLAQHIVAEAQKRGGTAAFIDMEHALDPSYAQLCGVDVDNLLISQPDTGEQALEIAETLIRSGAVDIIVVDSVAALVPRAELEGEMGDSHVGLQARLMSQALRKITGSCARTGTMVLFINQLRMKIGVMFGSPETTTGGNALKFYASARLDVRRIGKVKSGEEVTGNRTRVKVVKNKLAATFRQTEFDLIHGRGISRAGEVLDLAVEAKLVGKRGSWYSVGEESIGQGREAAMRHLEENPELLESLRVELLADAGIIERPEEDEELLILKSNLPFADHEILRYVVEFLQAAHQADERYSVRDGINIARYALKRISGVRDLAMDGREGVGMIHYLKEAAAMILDEPAAEYFSGLVEKIKPFSRILRCRGYSQFTSRRARSGKRGSGTNEGN